jgi:hypothetical protein
MPKDTPNTVFQLLPTASAMRKVLKTLGATVPERHPGQPKHPMGPNGDAAQMLGMLKGLVEQMTVALHGGPLHTDIQKGYFAVYERNTAGMFAAQAESARWGSQFMRGGVDRVPHASIQLLTAAAGLDAAYRAAAGAAVIAGDQDLTEDDAVQVKEWTEEAWEAVDVIHGYVEKKRAEWAAEDKSA